MSTLYSLSNKSSVESSKIPVCNINSCIDQNCTNKFTFPNVSKRLESIPLPIISSVMSVKKLTFSVNSDKSRIAAERNLIENSRGNKGSNAKLSAKEIESRCKIFGIKCNGKKSNNIDLLLEAIDAYNLNQETLTPQDIAVPFSRMSVNTFQNPQNPQFSLLDDEED